MDSVQDPYKRWGIVLIVFLLIFIPLEVALTKPNAISNIQTNLKLAFQKQPQAATIGSLSEIQQEEHSNLYYVDLYYDPIKKSATKIGVGTSHGDMDPLTSNPSSSSAVFNYKVEIFSPKNQLMTSGWSSLYKNVILTLDGKYKFRVSAPYEQGGVIKVYEADGQKFWEEKMN